MGEDIIGTVLSKEALLYSNKSETTGDKLQRFIHDQESIQHLRLLGSGIHSVVLLTVIKDTEYALKVGYLVLCMDEIIGYTVQAN